MPIESAETDKGILINVSGSLDRSASTELEDVVNDLAGKNCAIVVNLWDVNYISSVSIGTLVKLHSDLAEKKVSIGVSEISDECQKIFDMIELEHLLPVFKSDDDAFQKLST